MHLTPHEMKDFLLSTSTKCSILLFRGGKALAIPSPPPFLTALQYVINKDNNKYASQSRSDVNGTGTMWTAWHCQSSQQLPDINSSSLWRSCALSSPVQPCSQVLWKWGCLPRVEHGYGWVAKVGWKPSCCLCRPCVCSQQLLVAREGCSLFSHQRSIPGDPASPQETSPCTTTNVPWCWPGPWEGSAITCLGGIWRQTKLLPG